MLATVKHFIINRSLRKKEEMVAKVLTQYARFFCRKHFDVEFRCFIMFSDEKHLIGKFVSYFDIPIYIAIGRNFYYKAKENELFDVLEHELIHYSLCKLGLPYGDDDDNFQQVCEILNVPTEYNRGGMFENENQNDTSN